MSGHMHVKGDVKITLLLKGVKANTKDNDSAIDSLEQEAVDDLMSVSQYDIEIESSDIVHNTMEITGYDDPPDMEDR
jgi:hypothetical protein